MRSQLLAAVLELTRELPPATLESLCAELESGAGLKARARLGMLVATQAARERLDRLLGSWADVPGLSGPAVAMAIRASTQTAAELAAGQRVEIAWTGPSTEAVALRRVDQVLYELVESASTEILLVTYAAYKADRALAALRKACDRGVRVSLVLELATESGGKIAFDSLDSIRAAVPAARVFYWPLERRERISGSYGAMHVKCVVADRRVALVSSANLTDNALALNMEVGLVVNGPAPRQLAAHFEQLVWRGDLAEVPAA